LPGGEEKFFQGVAAKAAFYYNEVLRMGRDETGPFTGQQKGGAL
jgi:hypothetical protein